MNASINHHKSLLTREKALHAQAKKQNSSQLLWRIIHYHYKVSFLPKPLSMCLPQWFLFDKEWLLHNFCIEVIACRIALAFGLAESKQYWMLIPSDVYNHSLCNSYALRISLELEFTILGLIGYPIVFYFHLHFKPCDAPSEIKCWNKLIETPNSLPFRVLMCNLCCNNYLPKVRLVWIQIVI